MYIKIEGFTFKYVMTLFKLVFMFKFIGSTSETFITSASTADANCKKVKIHIHKRFNPFVKPI